MLDKKLHFGVGLLIALFAGYFFSPVCGLALAALAGVLKEARDWCSYRRFDNLDMAATSGGGVVGFLILEVMKWIC